MNLAGSSIPLFYHFPNMIQLHTDETGDEEFWFSHLRTYADMTGNGLTSSLLTSNLTF